MSGQERSGQGAAPESERLRFGVYEVFIQKDHASQHQHVGSVDAGSAEDAILLAKENFLRRDPCVNIWVVRQEQIHATSYEDPDLFAPVTEKAYRMTAPYARVNAEKWRKYLQKILTIDDVTKG
jgi:ring-1,2-phenylacetyl-CoA epoxidase subunit PaaB